MTPLILIISLLFFTLIVLVFANIIPVFGNGCEEEGECEPEPPVTPPEPEPEPMPEPEPEPEPETEPPTEEPEIVISSGGGGGDKHKTSPTSGNSWKTFERIVDDPIKINGTHYNIIDNWLTELPVLELKRVTFSEHPSLGQCTILLIKHWNFIEVKSKVAQSGLKIQEIALGVTNVGEYHKSKVLIEAWYDYDKSINHVVLARGSEYVYEQCIFANTDQVPCSDGADICYLTKFAFLLSEIPEGGFAVKAIDFDRRTMSPHYFTEMN